MLFISSRKRKKPKARVTKEKKAFLKKRFAEIAKAFQRTGSGMVLALAEKKARQRHAKNAEALQAAVNEKDPVRKKMLEGERSVAARLSFIGLSNAKLEYFRALLEFCEKRSAGEEIIQSIKELIEEQEAALAKTREKPVI